MDHDSGAVQRGGDQEICGMLRAPRPPKLPEDLVVMIGQRWGPQGLWPAEVVADDDVMPSDKLSLDGSRAGQRLAGLMTGFG
jgi:hypothetical protein